MDSRFEEEAVKADMPNSERLLRITMEAVSAIALKVPRKYASRVMPKATDDDLFLKDNNPLPAYFFERLTARQARYICLSVVVDRQI